MVTENGIEVSQWMKWIIVCLSVSTCGLLLLAALNNRLTGSTDQGNPIDQTAVMPIVDVTELFPMPKAKGRAKAKASNKKKAEPSGRIGYLIEEAYQAVPNDAQPRHLPRRVLRLLRRHCQPACVTDVGAPAF